MIAFPVPKKRSNPPLQQTGRRSRLETCLATACGRQLSGIVVRRTESHARTW